MCKGLLIFCLLVSFKWSHCQCDRQFLTEPDMIADSPLTCNIVGGTVVLKCEIEDMEYQIGWYFHKNEANAGMSTVATKLESTVNGYIIALSTGMEQTRSQLTIDGFNPDAHSGFYWCEIFDVAFSTSGNINPSQVVHISAPFTLDQLAKCSRSSFDMFDATTRCALGPKDTVNIIIGVEFTNITTTVPPTTIPTTEKPNTTTTTTTTEDATTEDATTTEEPITTDGSDDSTRSVTRTAIIWFSVGAVALVLIVLAIILCAVAIAKC